MFLVVAFLITTGFAGCGQTAAPQSNAETKKVETKATEATEATKKDDYVLKLTMQPKSAESDDTKKELALLKSKGFNVDILIIPGEGTDFDKKLSISIMSGEEMDILYSHSAAVTRYINSKTIAPLDELAKEANYDMEKIFGKYLYKVDNKTYGIPCTKDTWITMYNKKIFDDAKVPYPTAKDWTWGKYVETAKKLTDASKGIYGSFMVEDWSMYDYLIAKQMKAKEYKDDGTSNFDDPIYADAMKWYFDLGNVLKIQPDLLTYKSKKLPYDSFSNGKYAMFSAGYWSTAMMGDKKTWPRDWKFGILPAPYPDGGPKTLDSIIGMYCVPESSNHKQEAFAAVACLGENLYNTVSGRLPARVDLSDADITTFIENVLIPQFKDDGITVDDFKAALFDSSYELVTEQMAGIGNTVINEAFLTEGEMYGLGQKSLTDAMSEIKKKADAAIVEEKNAK